MSSGIINIWEASLDTIAITPQLYMTWEISCKIVFVCVCVCMYEKNSGKKA